MSYFLKVPEGGMQLTKLPAGCFSDDLIGDDQLHLETENGDFFELVAVKEDSNLFYWKTSWGESDLFCLPEYPIEISASVDMESGVIWLYVTTADELSWQSLELSTRYFDSNAEWVEFIRRTSEEIPKDAYSDRNYISNEYGQNTIANHLAPIGGVYLGVGPYQNYTYIAATRPDIAFIVDVRRDNLLQHMIAKVLIAESETRIEFLTKLLGRKPDPSISTETPLKDALEAIDKLPILPETGLVARVIKRMEGDFGFPLTTQDCDSIREYLATHQKCGLRIRSDGCNAGDFHYCTPTWLGLLTQNVEGENKNWLANDASFLFVKEMHEQNLIVPVVGDVAGNHAMPELARATHNMGKSLSYFYISNVEDYLTGDVNSLRRFRANVFAFPVHSSSKLIFTGDSGNALWERHSLVRSASCERDFGWPAVRGTTFPFYIGAIESCVDYTFPQEVKDSEDWLPSWISALIGIFR